MHASSPDRIPHESPSNSHPELRVLTLNCWGIPLSPDRSARMQAIGRTLAQMDLDIVGLQEIYLQEDRELVTREVAIAGLVHSHYFRSGVFGSGLFLLSRFLIENATFLRFRLNGRPQDLNRPDYYMGKGVGRARLMTHQGPIDVYNTHLIAPYLETSDEDRYFSHRVAQAYEVASYINSTSQNTPVIVTCDLNSTPERLAYKICKRLAGLEDSYHVANPRDAGITVTTDIPYIRVHKPERMDYVFCKSGAKRALLVRSSQVTMKAVAPGFRDQILAYSDHYAVYTTFELGSVNPIEHPQVTKTMDLAKFELALEEGLKQAQDEQAVRQSHIGVAALIALLISVLKCKRQGNWPEALRRLASVITIGAMLMAGIDLFLAFGIMGEEINTLRGFLAELEGTRGKNPK